MKPRASHPPRLLAISDRRALPTGGFTDWLDRLAAAGHETGSTTAAGRLAIQLREKDLDDRSLLELAAAARRRLPPPLRLLINGRPDIALAAGADGVHLPARGLAAHRVVERWGDRLWIGQSTHSVAEVRAAAAAGVDYVTFGPVWATPSKAAYGEPPGLAGLSRAAAVKIPILALGGVDGGRVRQALAAGAFGIAGIRCFAGADSIREVLDRTAGAGSSRWPA